MQRTRRLKPGPRLPSPALVRQPAPYKDTIRTPLEYEPQKKDNLFLWTVFLLVLLAAALGTWIGVYVVFGQPELPISYKILRKFKRLDPPQRFKVNAAPQGEFVSAEKLYNRYNNMNPAALREANRQMERSYLRNYPVSNLSAAYITGRFTIMDSYELKPANFFPSGVAALAVSDDYPRLMIEHVYPAGPSIAPLVQRNLQTGMDIELRRTYELTTVLHAAKLPDGHVLLTVVPLNYGSYIFKGTSGGFTLEPPANLNVAGGLPLLTDEDRHGATEAIIAFRQKSGGGLLVVRKNENEKPAESALTGVDAPIEPDPTPTPAATPTQAIASASPGAKGPLQALKKLVSPTATATPAHAAPTPAAAIAAAAATPVPRAVAVEASAARPPATPPPVVLRAAPATGLGGVSLQPFLGPQTNATANATARGSTRAWQTYAPGRMPTGKPIRVAEIATLSQKGGLNTDQPLYLNGQFVVKAVGENKARGIKNAVLRSAGLNNNVRVIVEYPLDLPLPNEGMEISRDESRPYQIMDVKQASDGTFNVFAREISEP